MKDVVLPAVGLTAFAVYFLAVGFQRKSTLAFAASLLCTGAALWLLLAGT